ncbi:acyl carrier protein [Trinickia sp. YCB016]
MENDIAEKNAFIAKVIGILEPIVARKKLEIRIEPDTPLFDSRILDSVTFVEFITALEVELDVSVPDQKMSTQFFATPAHIAEHFGN